MRTATLARASLAGALLLSSACSLAPMTVRDGARSLEAGAYQIDTGVAPQLSFGAAYGVTERLDVGVDLEFDSTLWVRHTVLDEPANRALAITAALFEISAGDTLQDDALDDPREGIVPTRNVDNGGAGGAYLGGLYTEALFPRVDLTLAYRFNWLDYEDFSSGRGGFLSADYYFEADGLEEDFVVRSEDFRGVGQVSATFAILLRSHLRLNLGGLCQLNHTRRSPEIPYSRCVPVLGLSFNRR